MSYPKLTEAECQELLDQHKDPTELGAIRVADMSHYADNCYLTVFHRFGLWSDEGEVIDTIYLMREHRYAPIHAAQCPQHLLVRMRDLLANGHVRPLEVCKGALVDVMDTELATLREDI